MVPITETNGVSLQSMGAAETVTGSKHLLKTPELMILIDCGLFQGLKALREENWSKLPVEASSIDVLILTHAHLDHSGYIPLLVKNGFKGKIYMTAPTREITELILLDSAKIQEEDAEKANWKKYSKHTPALPLYTIENAEAAFYSFVTKECNVEIKLSENISFIFKSSGHILGACSVEINCYGKLIIFSGDIGRVHSQVMAAPDYFHYADFVVMESTYGDRLHAQTDPNEELARLINETMDNKGNILIPSFAVGRAQELLYMIYQLKKNRKISVNVPVILDSPMAATATDIFLRYPEWTKISKSDIVNMCEDVLINQDFKNTQKIIARKGSKIIIAASGMLTGGRVLEYLKHYIGHRQNTVLIMGFQAVGTRGRALLDQAFEIKIHGRYYDVRAKVVEIEGLSAHADQSELLDWLRYFKRLPARVYLVHGEYAALEALRVKIATELKLNVQIMKKSEEVTLFNVSQASALVP